MLPLLLLCLLKLYHEFIHHGNDLESPDAADDNQLLAEPVENTPT